MNKSRIFVQVPGRDSYHAGYGYVLAWFEGNRLWGRDLMDDIEGVLATVMLWVDRGWALTRIDKSSARTMCNKLILAEWMTHHDDVPTRGQMIGRRYESISSIGHRAGSAFDSCGFGDGLGAAEDPRVAGYWSIELTRIEGSRKLPESRVRGDETWSENA